MNKSAKQYLQAVRRALRCPGRRGKLLLHQLGEDIDQYCEEHPAATQDELWYQFGTPADVAANFVEELGGLIAVDIQRRRNRIATVTIVLLVLVVGAVTARQIWVQNLLLDIRWIESITYEADEPLEATGKLYERIEFTEAPSK